MQAQSSGEFAEALKYLDRAAKIRPLLGAERLRKAQLHYNLGNNSECFSDAISSIEKIKKERYSESDRDYLIFFACAICNQINGYDTRKLLPLNPEIFHQIKYEDINIDKVSKNLLRNFPIKVKDNY